MSPIPITTARKNLYRIVRETLKSHVATPITTKEGTVVLISIHDWDAIQETLHLTSIPGMKESILKGGKEPLHECSHAIDL